MTERKTKPKAAPLNLSEIKLGYIGDEVRREMASAQCDQRHE
jgi:hypothetical protein